MKKESPAEPKTPIKTRHHTVSNEELLFYESAQKCEKQDFILQIMKQSTPFSNLFFSSSKDESSQNNQINRDFYEIVQYSNSLSHQSMQQEKYQTVKKSIGPNFAILECKPVSLTSSNNKGCNCDKSKCQKNYCICFKNGSTCSSDCLCVDCQNTTITSQLLKNEKIACQILQNNIQKGCNCKNSNCLKKYCQCHAKGQKCSELCRCESCHNIQNGDQQQKDGDNIQFARTGRKVIKTLEYSAAKLSYNKQNIKLNL